MDTITEIGLGGALVIAMGIIKDVVAKLLRGRNGNGHADSAGARTVAEWEQRIERVVERVVENKIRPHLETMHSVQNDIKQSLMTLIRWKGGD